MSSEETVANPPEPDGAGTPTRGAAAGAGSWETLGRILDGALERPEHERSAFVASQCPGDESLRAEVLSLLAAHQHAGAFLETPAVELVAGTTQAGEDDPRIGTHIGPYRIDARLGAGGMGEVYRARRADGQYERAVAIKLVRFGWKSAAMLERFRRERQFLAALESPGIARLYDGGTTEDGVPYVVMELVEGTPIDVYCREHALDVRERVALLRRVCEAVQYAHQRLVVHRDIKPSNILVTAEGVPKLLDFGIARALEETGGQEALPAATQAVLMTPAYASPEQIRGEPVTTASDIWSLGIVLFQLLTGREPFIGGSSHELAERVCDAEAPAPSSVLRGTGQKVSRREWRDLDNIVAATLRKEPARRYATVQQLTDDLGRWLEGSTVSATPDSLLYRLATFVRRHRLGVALSFIALVLSGAGVTVYLKEAALAAANGRRAERRFEDVHKLATSLVFDLHDAIRDLPGSVNARRLLADRAAHYLDDLARETGGDPALQRDLASALVRLGDVQGDPFSSASLGDTTAAERSYAKAVSLSEAVLARVPDSVPDMLALEHALMLHADVVSDLGRILEARREAERAAGIAEKTAMLRPHDTAVLYEKYRTYNDLGGILGGNFLYGNLGLQQEALRAQQSSLSAARQLAAIDRTNSTWQRLPVIAEIVLGDQLLLGGRIREALTHYRASLDVLKQQIAVGDHSSRTPGDLVDLYLRLMTVEFRLDHPQEALDQARSAVEAAVQYEHADAANARAQRVLTIARANLAEALALAGQLGAARDQAYEALRLSAAYAAAHATGNGPQVMLAQNTTVAGEVEFRAMQLSAALDRFREAERLFARTRELARNNVDARLNVAGIRNRIGDVLLRLNRAAEARATYRQVVQDLEADRLIERSEEARYALAGAYTGLGAAELRLAGEAEAGPRDARAAHIAAACESLRKGSSVWSAIREPGLTSPNGFHTQVSETLARHLAGCAG